MRILFYIIRDWKGPRKKRVNNPFINFLSDDFCTRVLLAPLPGNDDEMGFGHKN